MLNLAKFMERIEQSGHPVIDLAAEHPQARHRTGLLRRRDDRQLLSCGTPKRRKPNPAKARARRRRSREARAMAAQRAAAQDRALGGLPAFLRVCVLVLRLSDVPARPLARSFGRGIQRQADRREPAAARDRRHQLVLADRHRSRGRAPHQPRSASRDRGRQTGKAEGGDAGRAPRPRLAAAPAGREHALELRRRRFRRKDRRRHFRCGRRAQHRGRDRGRVDRRSPDSGRRGRLADDRCPERHDRSPIARRETVARPKARSSSRSPGSASATARPRSATPSRCPSSTPASWCSKPKPPTAGSRSTS